jgi:glucose-6-phosphate 1-dehydrogenase
MSEAKIKENLEALHPTVFVIFGITGDLASRKLLPALLSLYAKKKLPHRFSIIGFSRRPFTKEEFREYIRSRLNIKFGQYKEEDIKHFLDHIIYLRGLFDHKESYILLSEKLKEIDNEWGQCSNKLFHLSVPPELYEGILRHIHDTKLATPCSGDVGWTRILIEKPFGHDARHAQSLDALLGKLFKEKQIFRIDHYLAKEALQNILTFRFSNSIFEPLWTREYIDKVHIKLFEHTGVGGRGKFYDSMGATKDVGQNHMLMMLSLIAMDRPESFDSDIVRKERAKVLNKLMGITPRRMSGLVVRGQYEGYKNEEGVSAHSETETYVRMEAEIDSGRWKGVPFFMETGKAMSETKTEIDIYFKNFNNKKSIHDPLKQNILTFRIQPDEGIKIRFFIKTPGYGMDTESKTLKFKYADVPAFGDRLDDYERLVRDVFIGDQTLFSSTEEIMASWKFITPIIENWDKVSLKKYTRGCKEIE